MSSIPLSRPDPAAHCLHCGLPCVEGLVSSERGTFCCQGCEAVFELLKARNLTAYYTDDVKAGTSQKRRGLLNPDRFAGLDDPDTAARLLQFDDGSTAIATFALPDVHCASCVWLLEQLWRFDPGVNRSEVDLHRRTVRIEFRSAATSVRRIAEHLSSLGYEPVLDAERGTGAVPAGRRRLYQQIGVAGFAFGNIMLFSIPRYANGEALTGGFQTLFDALNLILALPVLLFSAADYFRTGWKAVRARTISIEVPVALGLTALYSRSAVDILAGRGPGFLDSFTGLVLFLLVGRLFQIKAFDRLAFDRSFRSFLPLAVHVERDTGLEVVPVGRLQPGDRLVLRRREIVPTDSRLLDASAAVDYRFLTGEEQPVVLKAGERVRAGGRAASAMRLCVLREASESQLARLWTDPVFGVNRHWWLADAGARFAGWFTVAAVGLAVAGAFAWWPDVEAAASVATAVLIVACPCALTLAAPITLGTAMGVLGGRGLYLKEPAVVLDLSRIDTVVFDKTGTLTTGSQLELTNTSTLSDRGWALVRRLALESSHPVSLAIAKAHVGAPDVSAIIASLPSPHDVVETPGEGVTGTVAGRTVAIGSASFVATITRQPSGPPDRTYVAAGGEVGWVRLAASARPGIDAAAGSLARERRLLLVSGDADSERARWARLFGTRLHFRKSPAEKLAIVAAERSAGRRVLMVGDGLNDAGALKAADVGLAVCDDSACLVPACDGVIGGDRLTDLPAILRFARYSRHIVVACFSVSLAYNAIGLTLALTGALTPLASAILMPVSSLTIVGLSSGGVRWAARRLLPS